MWRISSSLYADLCIAERTSTLDLGVFVENCHAAAFRITSAFLVTTSTMQCLTCVGLWIIICRAKLLWKSHFLVIYSQPANRNCNRTRTHINLRIWMMMAIWVVPIESFSLGSDNTALILTKNYTRRSEWLAAKSAVHLYCGDIGTRTRTIREMMMMGLLHKRDISLQIQSLYREKDEEGTSERLLLAAKWICRQQLSCLHRKFCRFSGL